MVDVIIILVPQEEISVEELRLQDVILKLHLNLY